MLCRQDFGGPFTFLRQLFRTRPKIGAATAEIWSVDHLAALAGMLSENFVRTERESNARRVSAMGAGEFIVPAADASGRKIHVSPDEVRAKVKLVLSTPSYTKNAKRISEKMSTFGGISWTARFIEDFCQDDDFCLS